MTAIWTTGSSAEASVATLVAQGGEWTTGVPTRATEHSELDLDLQDDAANASGVMASAGGETESPEDLLVKAWRSEPSAAACPTVTLSLVHDTRPSDAAEGRVARPPERA